MASIYNIPQWNVPSGQKYQKNDTVEHNGHFWYALKDIDTLTTPPTPPATSTSWGGVIQTFKSTHSLSPKIVSPHFLWKPSYNLSATHAPRVKSIKFGDGYEQRFKDGINNSLLDLKLTFDGRDEREAAAILHFLEARNGVDFFFFRTPSPYNSLSKFTCTDFSSTIVFKNNLNVSATFNQVP